MKHSQILPQSWKKMPLALKQQGKRLSMTSWKNKNNSKPRKRKKRRSPQLLWSKGWPYNKRGEEKRLSFLKSQMPQGVKRVSLRSTRTIRLFSLLIIRILKLFPKSLKIQSFFHWASKEDFQNSKRALKIRMF